MAMPNADDFLLEDTPEMVQKKKLMKGMDAIRQLTMGFLGKAAGLYKRAANGDPSPTLVGKAIAYLNCFQALAPEAGIKREMYYKIVTDLWEKLGVLIVKVDETRGKTIIEHRADPAKAALEQKKVELREKELEIRVEDKRKLPEAKPADHETIKVEAQPISDENVIKEVSDWLIHSQLGYEKADAQRRARLAYQPGVPVEELVARACRIG